jgi:uncharacterized membrane protein YfcA
VSLQLALGIVGAGVLVGVLSALFGIGGGILMVPFMVLALGEQQHLAEGTSLLVILPTAVAGVLMHRRRGYVSFPTGILLALGGIGGAWLGALLALRLSADALQTAFGVLMIVTGFRVIGSGIANLRREREARSPKGKDRANGPPGNGLSPP